VDVNLNYYKPINREQQEFHASKAIHKLLIGGYGAGKSYPAIHESIFHCLDNPRHNFYVFRNTWDSVEENIEEDILRICGDCGLIASNGWVKEKHNLTLVNGCVIRFRPLTLGRAKFKGIHCCGFLIDDPDVGKYQDLISFLFTRLRNPPNVVAKNFLSITTANYEGHDWLWETWMEGREEGGDAKFAYWLIPTTANNTLPENYVEDLKEVHSQEWIDRYVYCKMDSFIGLIYHSFSKEIHHFDAEDLEHKNILVKILAVDVGLTHATVVLHMCTDGKAIYVSDEFYRKGIVSSVLGEYLVDIKSKQRIDRIIIDPSSNKHEQTSGLSVREDIKKNYGIYCTFGNNSVNYGIGLIQDLLHPAKGPPKLFIDTNRCPYLTMEKFRYRWEEPPRMDTDQMMWDEKPVKKMDDCVDAERYGICYLRKYLKNSGEDFQVKMKEDRERHWEERFKKLKHYQMFPGMKGKQVLRQTYRDLGFSQKKIKSLISV
jgi:phage terminase large subunit